MGTPGPQKINRYGIAFKLKAVQMSSQPGVLVKDVAESLCIHAFMLSKWRKQVRDGELTGKPAPVEQSAVAELRRLREVEQQYKRLQQKHDLSYPVCLRSKAEVFAFIHANRQTYPVKMMCALYGVTRGGFYAWEAREPSARSRGDAELTEHVARVHRDSRGFYGSPRVVRKLRQQGVNVGLPFNEDRGALRLDLRYRQCLENRVAKLYPVL
jgi:transposase